MNWQTILILVLIVYGTVMMMLYLDKVTPTYKDQKNLPTLDWIREFYSQVSFPLTSPLTPQQFKTIKETIALLVQHEHYSYNRVPDVFDMYTSEETRTLAKMRKTNHLENHQRWRQIGDMLTRLTVEPEILTYINELMQNNPEFVLYLWGVPTDRPLELETALYAEIKKLEAEQLPTPPTPPAKEVSPPPVEETKPELVKSRKPRIYQR